MNLRQKGLAPILVGGISLALVLGLLGYFFQSANSKKSGEETSSQQVNQTEDKNSATASATNQNSAEGFSGTLLAGSSSPLLSFEKADYDKALQTGKLIVLYFYANWCPTCREEFPKMEEVFDELEADEVIGFRVNFNDSDTDDDEVELAREFGIAYQHTKVFLKNGERILKSPESWEKERYIDEINKSL
ncbi:MAG: thioredoxin family protein [Candidatus Woykebacteria bacterium]